MTILPNGAGVEPVEGGGPVGEGKAAVDDRLQLGGVYGMQHLIVGAAVANGDALDDEAPASKMQPVAAKLGATDLRAAIDTLVA